MVTPQFSAVHPGENQRRIQSGIGSPFEMQGKSRLLPLVKSVKLEMLASFVLLYRSHSIAAADFPLRNGRVLFVVFLFIIDPYLQ